nr:MAG TPA: hypothetical protein [Bacteriophage sp.]
MAIFLFYDLKIYNLQGKYYYKYRYSYFLFWLLIHFQHV